MATVGRETNWALPFATLSRSNLCPREPTNFVPSEQYEQSVDFQFIVQKSISINNFIDSSSWSLIWKDTSSYSYFFREIILYWNERVVKWPLSLWLFCKITDVAIIGKFLRILFGEEKEKVNAISRNYCSVLRRMETARILPFKACRGNLETGGLSNNSARQKDSLRFIKPLENLPAD